MKICVYGGQFGSEGKGSIAEAVLKRRHKELFGSIPADSSFTPPKLIVFGENSPNSGHTNSVGKTRNLPVSSFFADAVVMGPDSVIRVDTLIEDLNAIQAYRMAHDRTGPFQVYIHENAAYSTADDCVMEQSVVNNISSTGSGSGWARFAKCFYRDGSATVGGTTALTDALAKAGISCVAVMNNSQYLAFIDSIQHHDWLFECSQGALLDVNFGYFPFVTSRSTLPRVAIERNGLGGPDWHYVGVYRTFPIRTGGPSGPTGGAEMSFETIGVPDEIATVTKRTRRIFAFSMDDFVRSVTLTRPDSIAFTHLDYLRLEAGDINGLIGAMNFTEGQEHIISNHRIITSNKTGEAVFHD